MTTSQWLSPFVSIILLATLAAGCISSDCKPTARPAAHEWAWFEGPLDLMSAEQNLSEAGWSVRPVSSNGRVFEATQEVAGKMFTVNLITFENGTGATLTSPTLVSETSESESELRDVVDRLDPLLQATIGRPARSEYLGGYPCGEI